MIIVDGCKSPVDLKSHVSLQDVFDELNKNGVLNDRIVTDVFVNEKAFSELYPHQSEDISTAEIKSLELKTVSEAQMVVDVLEELPKVVEIMGRGSVTVAKLFRDAELAEGLELLQDLIVMNRNFLETVQNTRFQLGVGNDVATETLGKDVGDMLAEIFEAMEVEDWLLVADLLEYEYVPLCDRWHDIIRSFQSLAAKAA